MTHFASAVFASTSIIALVLSPVAAVAQQDSASPPGELRMEKKRPRAVVLPRPSDQVVREDVERAREAAVAPERREEIIRDSRQRPLTRPELDYSVTNAIQADRANAARR